MNEQSLSLKERTVQIITPLENQYKFVEEYLRCKSAQHAVYRAGFVDRVGLEAIFIGKEFLMLDYVKDSLLAAQQMSIMNPADVLAAISEIAQSTIEDFINFDADSDEGVIDLRKAQALNRLGAVKRIKHSKFGLEIEMHDRLSALKLLGQQAGLFSNANHRGGWRPAAIKDILAGTLSYDALLEAFEDPELVDGLFKDAGVKKPERVNLLSGRNKE